MRQLICTYLGPRFWLVQFGKTLGISLAFRLFDFLFCMVNSMRVFSSNRLSCCLRMNNELQALPVSMVVMFFASANLSHVLEVCLFGFRAKLLFYLFKQGNDHWLVLSGSQLFLFCYLFSLLRFCCEFFLLMSPHAPGYRYSDLALLLFLREFNLPCFTSTFVWFQR